MARGDHLNQVSDETLVWTAEHETSLTSGRCDPPRWLREATERARAQREDSS